MPNRSRLATGAALALVAGGLVLLVRSAAGDKPAAPAAAPPHDAVADAQTPREVPVERPEQKKTAHDRSDIFALRRAQPSSEALVNQTDRGRYLGFDAYLDPLGAMKPGTTFDELYRAAVAAKPKVQETQRKLLESRYILKARLDPEAKMSRGKPLVVGPTARLAKGVSWEALAAMSPADVRRKDIFPYKALPHPAQGGGLGGQVFPKMQTRMFPRLERFDVEHDLPEEFLPEFPPAMFLQNRPELGDVSRGEVVSINNYYRLFKDILTPVQLDGLRLLVTPFSQEEFNPTDDRKTAEPSLGVTCLDCHVNGHTSGQFHITPDIRPEERRIRLDTVSLRGVFNQQIHGSKRSLRSVEDFTEFEQPRLLAFVNFKPFYPREEGFLLRNLQLGGSVDLGNEHQGPVPAVLRTNFSPGPSAITSTSGANAAELPFLAFGPNVLERGGRALWEAHMAYYYQGLSLISAIEGGHESYANGATAPPVHIPISGWFVQGAYILTGETIRDRTLLQPLSPFDLRQGRLGTGAWEVTARYSQLDLDSRVFTAGLAEPRLWTNHARMVDVGMN